VRPAGIGLALLAATTVGCGEEQTTTGLRPALEEIAPAIAAVEAARGGPQQYFEINATPQFVNLFVAGADATDVQVYLYSDGELAEPTPPQPAGGSTFAATAAGFDAATIRAGLDEDLPDSDVIVFAIVAGPGGVARFSASVQSAEGGSLDVSLGPDGEVLVVDPGP